ncbi:MAG TPA: hypothetical protein PKG63_04405 [Bacteroidales bacterium]|nr:hypothetical protein [Bacteroidales bacterium]
MRSIQLLFMLFSYFSYSQEQLSIDSIKKMYKTADMIFTGIVIYENITSNTLGEESKLIDFDITEIQKGKDYSRLMVHAPADTMVYEQGKEYLVFAKRDKINKNQFNLIFAEHVCKSCTNFTIKKVYELVDKKPFATIKKPREKTPWNQRGCGCH